MTRDDDIRKARAARYNRLPYVPLGKGETRPKRPPGRVYGKRKDNAEAKKRAVQLVRDGSSVIEAARVVHVADSTVRVWCKAAGVTFWKRGGTG